jgi:hypothetical protein
MASQFDPSCMAKAYKIQKLRCHGYCEICEDSKPLHRVIYQDKKTRICTDCLEFALNEWPERFKKPSTLACYIMAAKREGAYGQAI